MTEQTLYLWGRVKTSDLPQKKTNNNKKKTHRIVEFGRGLWK